MEPHIVIVEPNAAARGVLQLHLEGHPIEAFSDHRKAIEHIRAKSDRIRLVITHWIHLEGNQHPKTEIPLGRHVLQAAKEKGIPVIVLSGMHGELPDAKREGASETLQKPVKKQQLIQAVKRHARSIRS